MGWYGPRGDCGCCNDPCVCRETGGLQVSLEVEYYEDDINVLLSSLRIGDVCWDPDTTLILYLSIYGLLALNGTYTTTLEFVPECVTGDAKIYADKTTTFTTPVIIDTYPAFEFTGSCLPSCSTFLGSRCCFGADSTAGVRFQYSGNTLTAIVYNLLSDNAGSVQADGFSLTIECPGINVPYEATTPLFTGGRQDLGCSNLMPFEIGTVTIRIIQV